MGDRVQRFVQRKFGAAGLPIDVLAVVSPASWHAKVKKIFDWVR